ncbi:recombinase family protein [uncultured Acetatifactor sp.]|uniref:recombinase family protein n=1 Tax=uncultured Acetatifactor sp. TaxID=1671927 RepID=UPI0026175BAD|nr:recombinase family protein [uncultured Acetatifactor sp.]
MKKHRKHCIAVYIRLSMEDLDLSSGEKDESFSIANQRNYIMAYLKQKEEFRDAKIREFVDDGHSGTNFQRPAVQEMLQLSRQGEIDCIVVKDLSRFGRNYLEVGDYLEQIFPFLGIRFISINDGYDSREFSGQTGGMDIAFKNFIYEMYSRDLSEKVKSGVTTCMKRGEYHSGCMVYGYEKAEDGRGMAVDPAAAAVIRRIFQEIAGGKRANLLARELNEEGIPTRLAYKQGKGEQCGRHYQANIWNHDKIHSIIHNRVYQGDMVYRKSVRTKVGCSRKTRQLEDKWIVLPDHHEAIVSKELFRKANDSIRTGETPKYDRCGLERGRIFCGCCGNRLELRRTKNPYYLCKRKDLLKISRCNIIRIEKAAIEKAAWTVWQEHERVFGSLPESGFHQEKQKKMQKQETALQQKLSRIPADKMKLYESFRAGRMTKDMFLREKELLNRQEEETRKSLEDIALQITRQESKAKSYDKLSELVGKYGGANAATDEFMKEMVEKVVVYEDRRIEIVWRYGDEFGDCV